MNVVRRDKWKRLGDLEPGQRFRRKDGDGETIRQVSASPPKFGKAVMCNRDDTGEHCAWPSNELVELVPGRWMPDEPEGLVAMKDAPTLCVVEWKDQFWHKADVRGHGSGYLQGMEDGRRLVIHADTLVRVVHGTFVEGYEEAEDD